MSRISDLMTQFSEKWSTSDRSKSMMLVDLVAIADEGASMERNRIIEKIRKEEGIEGSTEDPQPAGAEEFVELLKEFAKDRTHVDEREGPICSVCGGFVKPNGKIDHDPACATLRARELCRKLEVTL